MPYVEETMKLFRHGAVDSERAGAIDAGGVKRDLSLLVPDITPEWLSPEKLKAIAAIDLEKLPVVPEGTRIGAPVGGVPQFIAIGLNYRRHAAESGMPIPKDPLVFNKALTCIQGPYDDVKQPEGSEKMDWEAELAVGRRDQDPACAEGKRARPCGGLLPRQRRFRARLAGQSQRAMGEGQELRHVRAARSLARGGGWGSSPAGGPDPPRRERRRPAEEQHRRYDLHGGGDHLPPQPVHDPSARRCHRNRHARRCGRSHEAAAVPQTRGRR